MAGNGSRLEGEHFVFELTDHDPDYEGSCLCVYRLENGELENMVGGDSYAAELEFQGDEITARALSYLRGQGVKRVYTFSGDERELFGLEVYRENPEELDGDGAVNEWREYKWPNDQQEEELREIGIEVLDVPLASK
jgi:hypothetical protein